MNPAMKKSIILFVFIMLQPTLPSAAQKMSFKFNDVSLSEALRQIDHAQNDKHIVFMFDDLDMFLVNADLYGLSVAEAVHKVCDSHPVTVTDVGDAIFVEYVPKVVHLSPVVIYGENDAKQLSDDSLSVPGGDSSKRRAKIHSKRGHSSIHYSVGSFDPSDLNGIPVIEPVPDIDSYERVRWKSASDASFTSEAYEALKNVLLADSLSLGRMIAFADDAERAAIVADVNSVAKKGRAALRAEMPQSLLRCMERNGVQRALVVTLDGYEPQDDNFFSANSEINGCKMELKALVADAAQHSFVRYDRFREFGVDYHTFFGERVDGTRPTREDDLAYGVNQLLELTEFDCNPRFTEAENRRKAEKDSVVHSIICSGHNLYAECGWSMHGRNAFALADTPAECKRGVSYALSYEYRPILSDLNSCLGFGMTYFGDRYDVIVPADTPLTKAMKTEAIIAYVNAHALSSKVDYYMKWGIGYGMARCDLSLLPEAYHPLLNRKSVVGFEQIGLLYRATRHQSIGISYTIFDSAGWKIEPDIFDTRSCALTYKFTF